MSILALVVVVDVVAARLTETPLPPLLLFRRVRVVCVASILARVPLWVARVGDLVAATAAAADELAPGLDARIA